MNNMLSKALREFMSGPLNQLLVNLAGEESQVWEDALKRFLRKENPWPSAANNVYLLTVDYSRSVEAGIAAGKYDWKNNDITSKNFPTTRAGVAELEIQLVHFNREISSDEAIGELDKMGLRPAELHELLAFGENYPDVQREFPVIALGSGWRDSYGFRCVPYLDRSGSWRDLDLLWLGSGCHGYCRFAAVRK